MAAPKAKFSSHSPWSVVQNEVNQGPELRVPLIKDLEKLFGGKVVTFFTSFYRPNALIDDSDAEMLESILAVEHTAGQKIFLVINSPGGMGTAAERVVNICKEYSGNQFEAIVPHMAKSAATMICFGASAIHMSRTAELGPVDPQLSYYPGNTGGNEERPMPISAEEYVRSYDNLVTSASAGKGRIEPFLQQLNRYDSRFIEQLRSAQQLAKDISVRLLCAGMMKGKSIKEIEKKIKVFLAQSEKSSHGRMISSLEAEQCGLTIKTIDLQSAAWHKLWELYIRSNWSVTHECGKLMETSETGVNA